MVKVTGPGMSLDASGSLAGALVFSKWKGRNYIRQHVIPANPQSDGQVGMRSMFRWLSQVWTNVDPTNEATWDDLAADGVFSNFNAFMQQNQLRWRNFITPTWQWPAPGGMARCATPTIVVTGGIRQVTITYSTATINQNWGIVVMRSTTGGFTPAWTAAKRVCNFWTTGGGTWVDTPLTPGTYYYRFMTFDMGGDYSILGATPSAVVT